MASSDSGDRENRECVVLLEGHGAARPSNTELLLRETQRRLREAQRIANLGSWDWDIVTNELWWSQQIYTIFGIEPGGSYLSYELFLSFIHPDDLAAVEKAVDDALNDRAAYDQLHRIIRPDGAVRYVREQAEVFRDDKGRPLRMSGTVQDITDRHLAERARRTSESRLATMIDIAPEAVIATDVDGRIQIFNRGAEETFGYRGDEICGKPLDILIPAPLRDAHRNHVRGFEKAKGSRRLMYGRNEVSGLRKDGSTFPAQASVSKVDLDDGMIFIAILRDVTDIYRADAELREALEEANTANMAKSQFLATMSHEFRTPLNAILGFAEVLSQELLGPMGHEKYAEYADDILKSGGHLLSLVNDLLDFSAIEQGKQALTPEWLDLDQITMESVRAVEHKAHKRGIDINVCPAAGSSDICADKRALKQILFNLLSNAIKFTPYDGTVTVRTSIASDHARISVADTGVGIPEEDIPTLMQPFRQVGRNPYHAEKDWGLGLAISKSLVDLHGGKITVRSELAKGTEVTVELPVPDAECEDGRGKPT